MTLTTRSPAVSSTRTPTFDSVIGRPGVVTTAASGQQRPEVFYIESNVRSTETVPARHVTVDALVERWSADPHRSAAFSRARRWLADEKTADMGDTVRSLRLRNGLSQAQLAAAIATSQPHIATIERGTENVTIDTCRRLAAALGVDLNTLDLALRRQEEMVSARSSQK